MRTRASAGRCRTRSSCSARIRRSTPQSPTVAGTLSCARRAGDATGGALPAVVRRRLRRNGAAGGVTRVPGSLRGLYPELSGCRGSAQKPQKIRVVVRRASARALRTTTNKHGAPVYRRAHRQRNCSSCEKLNPRRVLRAAVSKMLELAREVAVRGREDRAARAGRNPRGAVLPPGRGRGSSVSSIHLPIHDRALACGSDRQRVGDRLPA